MRVYFDTRHLDKFLTRAIEEKFCFKFEELMSEGFTVSMIRNVDISRDPADTRNLLRKNVIAPTQEFKQKIHFIIKNKFFSDKDDEIEIIKDAVKPGQSVLSIFNELGVEGEIEGFLQRKLLAIVSEEISLTDSGDIWEINFYAGIDEAIRTNNRRISYHQELGNFFKTLE